MRLRILPYKISSVSSKELSNSLQQWGCKRINPKGDTKFVQRAGDVVINWGGSNHPPFQITPTLNSFDAVSLACNKLDTFNVLREAGVSIPEFTPFMSDAAVWSREGYLVYVRKTLTGHSGSGIVLAYTESELELAPLYTKQVKAAKEFRVHVFNNEVIDYAKKGRRADIELSDAARLIRSYASGWVFMREGVELPEVVASTALEAIKALNLDFGAVDIATISGSHDTKCVVYEVNTACGMQNSTINAYSNAITKYLGER